MNTPKIPPARIPSKEVMPGWLDLDIARQWFDRLQDIDSEFLAEPDYMLAKHLYGYLGLDVPSTITIYLNSVGEP